MDEDRDYTLSIILFNLCLPEIIKTNRLIRMHTIFARLEDHILDAVGHNNLNRLVVDLRNRR